MPFAPTDIAGLTLWLKADSLSLSDGDSVVTWTDSSTAGNNASGAVGVRPIYKTSIINGLPVVRFSGAQQMTSAQSASISSQTVFAVMTFTTTATNNAIVGASNNGGRQYRVNTSAKQQISKQFVTDIAAGTATLPTSTPAILAFDYDLTTYHFFRNGSADGSGTNAQTFTAGLTTTIGYVNFGTGPSNWLTGDLAELLVYNSVLSSTDRDSVTAFLSSRYAISTSTRKPPPLPAATRRQAVIRAAHL